MSVIENYIVPNSVEEAVEALAGGAATILAGGTDLMLRGEAGKSETPPTLMNIRRIAEIRGITEAGDIIRIGALTTITDLLADDIIAARLPSLGDMADQFGSNQIRNMATLGGNVCNASPAGDALVPLIVLDARVELASKSAAGMQTRTLALADFITAPGKTEIRPDEILVSVNIPVPAPGFVAGFRKVGPRPALEIAVVSVAIGGVLENRILKNVRVAFGAVAPTPIRGAKTEAVLGGRALDAETMAAAGAAAEEDISPISDIRATDWYRKHLIRVMTEDILNHVIEN